VGSITISGTNAAEFAQTNTCGTSLPANGSCTINVTFTPQATGLRSAAVYVADNADNSPQNVPISGTGIQGAVTLTPPTLTYTVQQYNTASKTQKVTVKNSGNAALTISG